MNITEDAIDALMNQRKRSLMEMTKKEGNFFQNVNSKLDFLKSYLSRYRMNRITFHMFLIDENDLRFGTFTSKFLPEATILVDKKGLYLRDYSVPLDKSKEGNQNAFVKISQESLSALRSEHKADAYTSVCAYLTSNIEDVRKAALEEVYNFYNSEVERLNTKNSELSLS